LIPSIIVLLSSTVGLIGFFISNPYMFFIGGLISFIDLIRYTILTSIIQYKEKMKFYNEYDFTTVSGEEKIELEFTLKSRIQNLKQDVRNQIIGFIVLCALLLWFFGLKSFVWIGIIGGFGYFYFLISPKNIR
jgi:hypothetical protein